MPQGYNTPVSERGSSLSGGQRQRLAIARALLLDKYMLLVLDEATSALDGCSEHEIQKALGHLQSQNKVTTLVVAHRLSTIRNADEIYVLDHGQVVEHGKGGERSAHEELLKKGGIYTDLFKRQANKA